MPSLYCQHCGTQIQSADIKFCSSCGSAVIQSSDQMEELPSPSNPPTGRLLNEVRLLDKYHDEVEALKNNLAEADPQTSKRIQTQLEQKMQIYWKQIQLVKSQFPDAAEGSLHEAGFYTFQALIKLFSAGLMRRMSARSGNFAMGIATGMIAKQQEKNNAMQALGILDQALSSTLSRHAA